jgi:hypothetical protein
MPSQNTILAVASPSGVLVYAEPDGSTEAPEGKASRPAAPGQRPFEDLQTTGAAHITYPATPGWKAQRTSSAAAFAAWETADTLRKACLEALSLEDLTADETAFRLGKSILSIRPRFSELLALGEIRDTGKRRTNASGRSAIVWTVRRERQGEMFE